MCQCGLELSNPCSCELMDTSSPGSGEYWTCNGDSLSESEKQASSGNRSCYSSCGDLSDVFSSNTREEGLEALDTGQDGILSKEIDIESSDMMNGLNGADIPGVTQENEMSSSIVIEGEDENRSDNMESSDSTQGDSQSSKAAYCSDEVESAMFSDNSSVLPKDEADLLFWMPPEPEDVNDEMDSVANCDEDDDYSDGTKWGQPTSLSSFDEELDNTHKYKEVRQKAMMDAMNGQFKILVSRFLSSEGLGFHAEGTESWLDIVASLSWEAASLIKPDATEGRAMDPSSYVKVKCVGTGAPRQSQVIKGLVFKKSTAHKHMPTRFYNPKLLLLKSALGNSASSLSSFASMEQEKDYSKSIVEMIEACNPNVVLVEKTVSRDIQEFLLPKGITLAFDMKLHRLERIARCTGSQIFSSDDIFKKPKLKQCDLFHVEKVAEEHNISGENAKKPSKTLMFLEGCPRPLGCTILLKGANSDELKKVKRVINYTVFAAYHLILETSFFADQRSFFSEVQTMREERGSPLVETLTTLNDATSGVTPKAEDNALISDPLKEGAVEGDFKSHHPQSSQFLSETFAVEPSEPSLTNGYVSNSSVLPSHFLSTMSASLRNFIGDRFPFTPQSISSYVSFEDKGVDTQNTGGLPSSPSKKMPAHDLEEIIKINGEISDHIKTNVEIIRLERSPSELAENGHSDELKMSNKDDIDSVLDPQTILILLSSQCITKGVVCEQSHLSRIKYYGNSDLSLGRYLQDTLLNKKHYCSSCGEPPEAHIYSFTHKNGSLTVAVRQLPEGSHLPGEAEGKIWMWTRCLKCAHEKGVARSTRRVVMSTAARGLSFGKFLELSFSSNVAASKLSKCGHLLHRDCLRFFGLGSKAAMFRYSPLEIYAACKPPPVLEFLNPSEQEWVKTEAREVLAKANHFFSEVADVLQKLKPKAGSLSKKLLKVSGAVKSLDEVEEILNREKAAFEVSVQKAVNNIGPMGKSIHDFLDLNWVRQELLLELYVWDRRLHFLLASTEGMDISDDAKNMDPVPVGDSSCPENHQDESTEATENKSVLTSDVVSGVSSFSENPEVVEASCSADNCATVSEENSESVNAIGTNSENESDVNPDQMHLDNYVPVVREPSATTDYLPKLELVVNEAFSDDNNTDANGLQGSKSDDLEGWVWMPLAELKKAYRKDLNGGYLHRFGIIHSYKPSYLSSITQATSEQRHSLHFPVWSCGKIMSVCEDEVSSIIACALAMSESQSGLIEGIDMREADFERGYTDRTIEKSYSISSDGSMASTFWSSNGSSDSEGLHSSQSLPSFLSDEVTNSGYYDGSFLPDRLVASDSLHPEVNVGISKIAGKSKYSVVFIYAKEFYDLRKRCCPSELAYISSLSHCKKWDVEGGKSKAFFAKSMDDRFIIKQIKKTELDSFLKFAPEYFKHVATSIDSGSQTCLAKILGIYQVKQYKGGKEIRIDLMVMENLLYGHNISRTYDLKGAVFSRYVSDGNDPNRVLLDENFVEDMRISPIYIGGRTKHLLQRAIWNDTAFLTSINVMDYSLLVGVDKERHELVFGIIDYLRQYTWDKQLETWVKSSLVVPKNELPTIISPREYKKRFRKFMTKYFLTVPDNWSSEQCNAQCKFCNEGNHSNSSNQQNGHPPELSSQA